MRYKRFGEHTGLRVSELVLGTGNFGTRWGYGALPDDARRIFEAYADAGGNFIDTANSYQLGESEEIVGELLKNRRDDFVLATKFSDMTDAQSGILVTGNSRKAMVSSVEASLKRLNTDRIDVYWLHMGDDVTPTDEIVRGFEDLVRTGKILYAGLSNFPAWRVSRAVTLADVHNIAPVAGVQVEYSLVERTTEIEMIPAATALGLGVLAWSPLGGGMLTGKYRAGERGRAEGLDGRVFQAENSAQRTAILDAVIAVAHEIGVTAGEVAIAWVAAKGATPIIGPRTVEQLHANLAAANVRLTADQIQRLDKVSAVASIYPYTVTSEPETAQALTGGKHLEFDRPTHPVA
ncbi:aldo/keto reductase [Mycobacterium sp. pUA109]|uniref:aldo/keto reductase n=1 Tax=Mycobacterium sp. pUA109 TaxID=3238982 RepID=UPI00351BE8C6